MQGVQQNIRQRVPSPEAHDKPRRERSAPQVQMPGMRKSVQVQTSSQGKDTIIINLLLLLL